MTFLFLLSLPLCAHGAFCFFTPPTHWEFADPVKLAPRVKVGFVGRPQNNSRPSLNLAIEEGIDLPLEEYLLCLKNLYAKRPENRWRDLGSFRTAAGAAHLISLDTTISGQELRLLQLIFLQDRTAYILTAGAAKSDFALYYKDFETAFRTLHVTQDLLLALSDPSRQQKCRCAQEALQDKWKDHLDQFSTAEVHFNEERFQNEEWIPFQKRIQCEGKEWGPYGQLLFLQETKKQLFAIQSNREK